MRAKFGVCDPCSSFWRYFVVTRKAWKIQAWTRHSNPDLCDASAVLPVELSMRLTGSWPLCGSIKPVDDGYRSIWCRYIKVMYLNFGLKRHTPSCINITYRFIVMRWLSFQQCGLGSNSLPCVGSVFWSSVPLWEVFSTGTAVFSFSPKTRIWLFESQLASRPDQLKGICSHYQFGSKTF